MVILVVQFVVTQDFKKVPHNGSPKRRERLTANGDGLACISVGVLKDNPEQDIVSFPTPCTALLNNNLLVAALQVVKYLIRSYLLQVPLFGITYRLRRQSLDAQRSHASSPWS